MKSLLSHLARSLLTLISLLTPLPSLGQSVPADLEVIGTAGGLVPGAEYATVRISTNRQGTYHRFLSGDLASAALASNTFTVTTVDIEQLWQVVQDSDFFSLDAEYAAEDIIDRTFARLVITANGSVHTVTTQNVAVEAFDNIVSALNSLTPGDQDLVYDTSVPFTFTSRDVCEQPGKQGPSPLRKATGKTALEPAAGIIPPAGMRQDGGAHPGSVVAYRLTLEEAIKMGIVTLSSKGGTLFGDVVSISIDNASGITSDRLALSLYLDLWGAAASASAALAIEQAIEGKWGGRTTTNGQPLAVDVVTRITPGGTTAPGTTGYHQLMMVMSGIMSHVNGDFALNQGVGSGIWATTGSDLDSIYAHEAGHFFGLPDRYVAYNKQADGTWLRESDGQSFSTASLVGELSPSFPHLTPAEILAKLEDGRQRVTAPATGNENDLMATLNGTVQLSDIDAIAAQAGLIIEVRPGDILLNKDGRDQSHVITRSVDVFVPAGGSKTLDGLYAACIDNAKGIPNEGIGLDMAPSLSDWRGIEAAPLLQQLVDYVDAQEQYCPRFFRPQLAVWRITDNAGIGDADRAIFLREAGIDLGDRILDFPRLTNPNSSDPNTTSLTPPELFVLDLASATGNLVNPGETVTLTGTVHAPSVADVSIVISWSLDTPAGSAATLISDQGETTMFTTDVRGIYQVLMQVEVADALADTLTRETVARFTAADTYTETFEAGILEPGGPFFWETSENNPWVVTESAPHTGVFSIASADIDHDGVTWLEVNFEQVVGGPISFTYKVSSERCCDSLTFSIDGAVQGRWSGELDWSTFSIDLSPGTHTAVWTYKKDDSFSVGADRVWVDDVFFPEDAVFTAIEGPAQDILPATYQLSQNYPNPFNPTTTITYALPQPQHVTLVVYDALGRQVVTLVERRQSPGQYRVQFDARGLSNGVYYYELRAGTFKERKAMVLVR